MFVFHNPQISYMTKYKNVEEYQLTIDKYCLETTKTPMSWDQIKHISNNEKNWKRPIKQTWIFFPPENCLFTFARSIVWSVCAKKDVKSVKIKLENQNNHKTGHNLEEK
jgi:hypothetical protein